jgi:hypothetical protein
MGDPSRRRASDVQLSTKGTGVAPFHVMQPYEKNPSAERFVFILK